jgi:hypothetical protein
MTTTTRPSVETQGNLDLSYNNPVTVPTNWSAVCAVTTQATSILQVQNLSTSNVASFFVNAGGTPLPVINIQANDRQPYQLPQNFNGAKLVVTNISTSTADILVTLQST